MAKQSRTDELFEMLRARGLRTRVARALSDAAGAGRSGAATSQKAAMGMIGDLRKLADDLEERVTGKSSSRSEAAKKAARTRERKAKSRSAAAKKGAATRKRSASSSSGPKRAASTAKRAASTAKRATTPSSGGSRKRTSSSRAKKS